MIFTFIMQNHICVRAALAYPQERDGADGYHLIYGDGYESWLPRDVFERCHFPIQRPDRLTEADIAAFMAGAAISRQKAGEKTTLLRVEMQSGWVDLAHSSCVDAANYDQETGEKICMEKITDRLWNHLGFVLQWARHGLKGGGN